MGRIERDSVINVQIREPLDKSQKVDAEKRY